MKTFQFNKLVRDKILDNYPGLTTTAKIQIAIRKLKVSDNEIQQHLHPSFSLRFFVLDIECLSGILPFSSGIGRFHGNLFGAVRAFGEKAVFCHL